jgi:prepilin-type N-terminal cleavage/methylation domain-containing protein
MKSTSALPRAASHKAFTLIEILTTISIVVILAALLLNVAGHAWEKGSRDLALSQIHALQSGIDAYKLDYGSYPEWKEGSATGSTKVLITELVVNRINANPPQKPYVDIQPKMYENFRPGFKGSSDELAGGANYLQDPFGNPYHYQSPGDPENSGVAFYDLWSQGKKNSSDKAKWIKNW